MRTRLMLLLSVMMIGWTIPVSHSYNGNMYKKNNMKHMQLDKVMQDYDGSGLPVFVVVRQEYEPEDGQREEREYSESLKMKRGGKSRKTDGRIRLLKVMV